jgi:Flp pilus assembly protein TadB
LPLILGALLWILSPAYIDLLFTEKSGNNLLLAAVILLATGLLVIRTIIKKSLPA